MANPIKITVASTRPTTDVNFYTISPDLVEYIEVTYGHLKVDTPPVISEDGLNKTTTREWIDASYKTEFHNDPVISSFQEEMNQYNLNNGITVEISAG